VHKQDHRRYRKSSGIFYHLQAGANCKNDSKKFLEEMDRLVLKSAVLADFIMREGCAVMTIRRLVEMKSNRENESHIRVIVVRIGGSWLISHHVAPKLSRFS